MSGERLPLAGPRRLILIHSGKYDYAELDLTRPFQLVGVNGLGKTALISTLQYLYLDSQRDMRFGQHSADDSRRFYFRGEASFILFECESSLGTVTMGARGLGAISGHDLQRFAWSGSYVRDDFVDEKGRPRPWDEVRAILAAKGLQVLTDNAELRRLLGAVDEETSTSWGLVPLAHAGDYPRFRQTFQRLLQLHDLRQNDLKELIANCAKLSPSEREIELAKDFEKELGRITRDRAEVDLLRAAAPRVQEVRNLHDVELVARATAHAMVRELQTRHAGYAAWFKQETDALYAIRNKAIEEHRHLEIRQTELQKESRETSERAGGLRRQLEELESAKARYANFVLELEEQVRDRLREEISGLTRRLADVPKESRDTLARQLGEKQSLLAEREAAAARIERLFITWLRARLPAEHVARLGAMLERRVLESSLDEAISVQNEAALLQRLAAAAQRCDARGYADDAVAIEFPPGATKTANQFGRPERLQEEIRELRRTIDRLKQNIETLENAQALRARLPISEREYEAQIRRLDGYTRFREEMGNEEAHRVALASADQRVAEIEQLLKANETARTKAREEGQAALDKFNQFHDDDLKIRSEARNPPAPPGDDPGGTPLSDAFVQNLPASLLDVFRIAREKCSQARTLAAQLSGKIELLDRDFVNPTFRYDLAAPVDVRLRQLEAEIVSLDERSHNIESRWLGVLTDARSSFHTILKSLQAVTRQARKLTGELAKIEFSSLAEVRLEIVPNEAAVAEYERHAKDSAQPSLFDTAEEADRKLAKFSSLLQRRPKLVLNELFSLRCEVRRKDGVRNTYDDFDQVESTGTTVVLKVTLNLLVLRDLLVPGKARIPYYLDEVHALDRQNFANILQLSERLGFVGIYAAPTAAIGPRRFVHLVPDTKGRLVVTAAHCKDIVRAPEDAASTAAPAHG